MKFDINDTKIQIAIASVLLIILAVGGFFYFKSQGNLTPNTPAGQNTQNENRKIIAEVSKLIDLPTNEEPTIATITDISKLKDQPFFLKAKNGDKVLIYSTSRKAILYDPLAKKILDVTIINLGTPSAQIATPSASPK